MKKTVEVSAEQAAVFRALGYEVRQVFIAEIPEKVDEVLYERPCTVHAPQGCSLYLTEKGLKTPAPYREGSKRQAAWDGLRNVTFDLDGDRVLPREVVTAAAAKFYANGKGVTESVMNCATSTVSTFVRDGFLGAVL